jgi:hypothetical protein
MKVINSALSTLPFLSASIMNKQLNNKDGRVLQGRRKHSWLSIERWRCEETMSAKLNFRDGRCVRMEEKASHHDIEVSLMQRVFVSALSAIACCMAFSTVVLAGGADPADYPLRVNILTYTSHSRHARESKAFSDAPDYLDGLGQGDLFENGVPRGFTFTYSCIDALRASSGYETFPARWKKADKTVTVLLPEPGKPWNWVACDLRTEMRPGMAYFWHEGSVVEKASTVLKDWMVKHQWDPENGKDQPVDAEPGSSSSSGTSSSQGAAPQ